MLGRISSWRAIPTTLTAQPASAAAIICRFASTKRKRKVEKKLYVSLRKDVKGLGSAGSVVGVAGGFFRNKLLPRRMAEYATAEAIADAKKTEQLLKEEMSNKSEYERFVHQVVKKMTTEPLRLQRLQSDFEVTVDHIVNAVARQWRLRINPEAVVLHESLRSLGTHPVDVQVDDSTSATLQVYIGKDPVDPLGLKLLIKKQAARAAAAEAL